jgi:hypothetical protein
MDLPNEIIQCILEMAELPIDSRLAFNIKPKNVIVPDGLSEKIKEISYDIRWNLQYQNVLCKNDQVPDKCAWFHEFYAGEDEEGEPMVRHEIFEFRGEIYSGGSYTDTNCWFKHSTGEIVNLWSIEIENNDREKRISRNRKIFHQVNSEARKKCELYCRCYCNEGDECICTFSGECSCNWVDVNDSDYETENDSVYDFSRSPSPSEFDEGY